MEDGDADSSPCDHSSPRSKKQFSSPYSFATSHLTACVLNSYLPATSRPMEWRTLSQRPTCGHFICKAVISRSKMISSNMFMAQGLRPRVPVTGARNLKSAQSGLERVRKVFWTQGAKSSCTGAKESCTGAKQGLGAAKDSWETFAPWVQNTFCTTLGTFELSDPCSRQSGSQPKEQESTDTKQAELNHLDPRSVPLEGIAEWCLSIPLSAESLFHFSCQQLGPFAFPHVPSLAGVVGRAPQEEMYKDARTCPVYIVSKHTDFRSEVATAPRYRGSTNRWMAFPSPPAASVFSDTLVLTSPWGENGWTVCLQNVVMDHLGKDHGPKQPSSQ